MLSASPALYQATPIIAIMTKINARLYIICIACVCVCHGYEPRESLQWPAEDTITRILTLTCIQTLTYTDTDYITHKPRTLD